ncbi:MAG: thymidine kinase [Bacteroidales bacterium]|nr:thymidine kinase [Bacteroidales bacterium]
MYDENDINTKTKKGWIEVITGSMFSGKTEELIRRLRRVKLANQKVKIFKHALDKRFASDELVTHDDNSIPSISVSSAREIIAHTKGIDVVGIDEGQFFSGDLIEICNFMANSGIRIIVAGLDMDYQGKPFGSIPALMAVADFVTKLHAVCVRCGNIAQYSHRKIDTDELVLLGAENTYEPLCRECYLKTSERKSQDL